MTVAIELGRTSLRAVQAGTRVGSFGSTRTFRRSAVAFVIASTSACASGEGTTATPNVSSTIGDAGGGTTGGEGTPADDRASDDDGGSSGDPAPGGDPASGETGAADSGPSAGVSDADGSSGAGESTGSEQDPCDDPDLQWHSGMKTTYESYPEPGSDECVIYNGCEYLGQFAACDNTMPERWVEAHDIVAVFPLGDLALHRLCLRSGATTMVVTAIDTCGDDDCDGCCTDNLGDADALIDIEKYTNERFGVEDGEIEWADLGMGDPSFDGCN